MSTTTRREPIRTSIPARLDPLRWTPFHTRMLAGPGAAWVLDGLQITVAGSVTRELTKPATLDKSATETRSDRDRLHDRRDDRRVGVRTYVPTLYGVTAGIAVMMGLLSFIVSRVSGR